MKRWMVTTLLLVGLSPSALFAQAEATTRQARALWSTRTEPNLRQSLTLFARAADSDPEFAPAYAGMADAYCLLALYGHSPAAETMPEAQDAAEKAILLDDSLAEAYASFGLTQYLYDWDAVEAERSFTRSIELDPSYAAVRHWYAMMLMVLGRYGDAVRQIERAAELSPDAALYAIKTGTILMAAGELDEAEIQLLEAARRFPDSSMAHRELGRLALSRERPEDALAHYERAAERSTSASRTEAGLGLVYGLVGRSTDARAVLQNLRRATSSGFVSPIAFALVHAGLGETELALEQLDVALRTRDAAVVYLSTQPELRTLRTNPEFQNLVNRLGFTGARHSQ